MKYRFILSLSILALSIGNTNAQTAFTAGNLLVLKAGNSLSTPGAQAVSFVELTKGGQAVQVFSVPSVGTDKLALSNPKASAVEGFINLSNARSGSKLLHA